MFEILTAEQLIERLKGHKYKYSQIHHTWEPNHNDFNGHNHLELQQGMKNYHMNTRGWNDIGQHVTLFPDGKFVTGRPFNQTPAGIEGYNTGAFMTEMLGNFDKGHDKLEGPQHESMMKLQHFLITECEAEIMFHREHASKTCPGTGIDKGEFLKQVITYGQAPPEPAPRFPYPGVLLKKGSTGSHVKLAQSKVGVTPDGVFGPKTEAAVKAYQAKHGLAADGIIGPKTWKVMFN